MRAFPLSYVRFFQALLIVSVMAFSWLAMMATHELGHVLTAWATGGSVARVMLHPLELSQTIFADNPHPLPVVWGGPIGGCIIPLAILGVVFLLARPYTYLARFFAGFCLTANGAYLGGGAFLGKGLDDASLVLRLGGARWQLVLFALVSAAFGLYLCHGLGTKFGLGETRGQVDRRAALGAAVALVVLVVVELVLANES